jgi:type I restriction enzyme S subunit
MTADLLIENFETLAGAPGGVPKLRELIFSLAIAGELVPADERDSWPVVRLEDVGAINPRNSAPDATPVGFVPMKLISTDYRAPVQFEPRAWGDVKKAFTHLADGDVALAKITPCFENGKACHVRGLPSGLGAGTTELHVFRPDRVQILPEYALVFLKSPDFVRAGIPRMTGSAGQKRVPADYFTSANFPLPPLPEQHRIVAKVDALMALCDALEARTGGGAEDAGRPDSLRPPSPDRRRPTRPRFPIAGTSSVRHFPIVGSAPRERGRTPPGHSAAGGAGQAEPWRRSHMDSDHNAGSL